MTRPDPPNSARVWPFHVWHFFGILIAGMTVGAIVLSFQWPRETGGPRQSRHNLKIIGFAAYQYDGANKSLPPGMTRGIEDVPIQSWQTLLLPYLGQEPVYRRVRLEAPWNDPVNREVCSTRIIEYMHPAEEAAFFGGYPVTHYAGNSQVLLPDRGLRMEEIRDGTSNVILSGEVETGPRPWAEPGNVRDPAEGLGLRAEQFGRRESSKRIGVSFVMLDGAVRYFDDRTDPAVLKALASPAGGEAQIIWP